MDISIITVNYRGWEALNACLHSLQEIPSSPVSFEVIIVDNDSNDGKINEFRKAFPEFTFVENSGNNGFSNGCNLGAKHARGNFLFFLNPDTTLTREALVELHQTAVSHPEIGILSCLQINENGKYYNLKNLFPSFSRFFGLTRAIYRKMNTAALEEKFAVKKGLFYPDWVTGAVIFMSRDWFEKVNGWNEDYWLYFEDVDLCRKVTLRGGKVAVDTQSTIFHKHGGASRINVKTKAITKTEVIISKHVYIHNHFPPLQKFILHSLLIITELLEKFLLSIAGILLFFIPKLRVNFLILKRLVKYYLNAIKHQTWISPRAENYPEKRQISIL